MKSLREMATEVARLNMEKGWRSKSRSFGEFVALLHSEVSEMLEAFRSWGRKDATATPEAKPEGIGSEAADVLIRLLDMCEYYSVDLEWEFERKMAYNRTRGYRHGGKRL